FSLAEFCLSLKKYEKVVWDALQPRSCDTHSTSYSATRETFLKLLRPGVDYREAF
ncbi:unnamed protein product, partial [Laminaria digitata]